MKMKRALVIAITIWSIQLFSVTAYMKDGMRYEGTYEGKLNNHIYLLNNKVVYELSVKEIDVIMKDGKDNKEIYLMSEDYIMIDLEDKQYMIYTDNYSINIETDNIIIKEELLKMSDREFAIYEIEQRQRQADIAAARSGEIRDAIYISGGILTAAIIIINIVYYQKL